MQDTSDTTTEPQVIQALRSIVEHKQFAQVRHRVRGDKPVKVDLFSASAILAVYDALSPESREKYLKLSVPKMASVAFKLLKPKGEINA